MPEVAALGSRLERIEHQLGDFGKLFGKVSELMERMVKLEEQKSSLVGQVQEHKTSINGLYDRIDDKFEKLTDKFETKLKEAVDPLWAENKTTNEKLNGAIMKIVWISAMLSAAGGVFTLIGSELVKRAFH